MKQQKQNTSVANIKNRLGNPDYQYTLATSISNYLKVHGFNKKD